MSIITHCGAVISQIEEHLQSAADRLIQIDSEISQLEDQGVFSAIPSESWEARNGGENRYLRLVFPTEHGRRRREYVGADPDNIEAARAKIARTQRLAELEAERGRITRHVQRAKAKLRQALNALEGKTVW